MADEAKLKEYQDKLKAAEEQDKADKEAREAAEAKLKKFKEDQEKDRQEFRVKAFKDECEALVKDGKLTPAERDKLVKGIPEFKYDESGHFVPFVDVKAIIENRKILDTVEYGEDGKPIQKAKKYDSASEEMADRAKTYSIENKVSYSEAVDIITAKDADLAERYKLEDLEE